MERMRPRRLWFHRHKHLLLGAIAFCFFSAGSLVLWAATVPLPDLASLEERKVMQSTKIYDRTGEIVLYDFHNDVRRTVIPFENISRNIKNATVAIEDERFYEHNGIQVTSIIRAVLADVLIKLHVKKGFTQGGSTITQQVVKNSLLTKDKTLVRKVKEWVLAIKLDRAVSKDVILNLYLNEAPYGGNLYGIEEASRSFFGVDAADLTLAQAAYLAALPQAPTRYSPYGNHRDLLESRKNLVLFQMKKNDFITESEYEEARAAVVEFLPQTRGNLRAPHFVFYIREYLEELYGDRALAEEGFRVVTTLDYNLQAQAERIVKEYGTKNETDFNASNAALVAIDPKTGQILTMVGSRDYFDESVDGNFNVAIAHRQPGSTFKPFVYATAFKKGYTPDTVVFDIPTQFQTTCAWNNFGSAGECYSPENFDGKFRGPIKLRNAIAESRNIPSVKVLYLAGIKDSLQTAADLGVTSLSTAERYGLTLVLGGGEVSLLDLTGGYGVFANDGIRNPTTGIISIADSSGHILKSYSPSPVEALSSGIARQVNDILSDNDARAPEFGLDSPLYFPGRTVAAKTGTTNDYRDVWTVGYTPSVVVGVWGGNNDNSPIEKQIAGFVIAPMWHAFTEYALANLPQSEFIRPEYDYGQNTKPILRGLWQGGDTYTIDKLSGKLATEYTPQETREVRASGGGVHSILHYVDRKNPTGPAPSNPNDDPQYRLWEPGVALWVAANGYAGGASGGAPTEYDDIHTRANMPVISITSPASGASLPVGARATITVSATGRFPITKVEYSINGLTIGSATVPPYSFSFRPQDVQTIGAPNTLTAIVYDSVFNKTSASVSFSIN